MWTKLTIQLHKDSHTHTRSRSTSTQHALSRSVSSSMFTTRARWEKGGGVRRERERQHEWGRRGDRFEVVVVAWGEQAVCHMLPRALSRTLDTVVLGTQCR